MKTEKQCYRCKEVKSLSEFRDLPNGNKHSYCEPCRRDYVNGWSAKK